MDEPQVEAIIEERINEVLAEKPPPVQMISIRPFRAWDEDDRELEVVGVIHDGNDLQFIGIVERGGECFPSMLDVVYRTPPAGE